jgi:group II intron reverse transcriptase/maturase
MNIGEMQRSLSLKAEKMPKHRFDDLFSLICSDEWLCLAHDHVARNAGSVTAGCDGITMARFDEHLEDNLRNIRDNLKAGTFVANPVRRVYIPKSNGKMRPLGIPSIKDRIVQEAVRMVLEPIYEAEFCQDSFGFQPNRCTMDAVTRLWTATREGLKNFWVIEGDISAYFDTIHHRKLMKLLRRRVKDEKFLDLIWAFLRAGVMERKLFKDTKKGTPQGGIISPLLANVYLHELDKYMEQKYTGLSASEKARRRRTLKLPNVTYTRYADDFVVLCNGTKEQAFALRDELRDLLENELRLTLSMEKTKVTHLNDGFDFLGFNLRRKMCQNGMRTIITIAEKSMKKHLEAIKAATSTTSIGDSLITRTDALNRIIVGWCRYYQHSHMVGKQFSDLAHRTFWLYAGWLCRKMKLSIPEVMKRFHHKGTLGALVSHNIFKHVNYAKKIRQPNPYTTLSDIEREELLETAPWYGYETRPGQTDLKFAVLERDNHRCTNCGKQVEWETSHLDHVRPYSAFKLPVNANAVPNLRTLCLECHKSKHAS